MEKVFYPVVFDDVLLEAEILQYHNPPNKAIQLWQDDEPYLTASVNVTERLADNEVAIKDYSENVGVLSALVGAGIVSAPVRWLLTMHVQIPVCRLLV